MKNSLGNISQRLADLSAETERLARMADRSGPVTGIQYSGLADTVRRVRADRRQTLRQVSAECGIDFRGLQRLEAGHNVTARQLERLAKWLGQPIVFLP